MDWIALQPTHDDEAAAWSWHGLQFTPRVAWVEDSLLLEVSGSARLFGGPEALRDRLLAPDPPLHPAHWARAGSSLVALALLRLKVLGREPPPRVPHDLALALLSVAVPHVPLLERTGCRTWGQLRALPRGPVARRFGAALLDALDAAWGERPERYPWLTLPEIFDVRLELPALATQAPELMWTAQRLLGQLQLWLRARQQGVLALELEWTLDLRRLDGRRLPSHEQLVVRTAQPAQETSHLRRLVSEQLDRATLAAPVNQLRLRTLETAAWVEAPRSFLPEDNVKGEKLHQLVERLSARLGQDNVLAPLAHDDWRPERMQRWAPATQHLNKLNKTAATRRTARVAVANSQPQAAVTNAGLSTGSDRTEAGSDQAQLAPNRAVREGHCLYRLPADLPVRAELVDASACSSFSGPLQRALSSTGPGRTEVGSVAASSAQGLYPPWLLPQPLRLEVRDHRPWYEGAPLRLLTRRQRVETGWWEEGGAVVRDYCIAGAERAGLLWIYCEYRAPARPLEASLAGQAHDPSPLWYLQGFYA